MDADEGRKLLPCQIWLFTFMTLFFSRFSSCVRWRIRINIKYMHHEWYVRFSEHYSHPENPSTILRHLNGMSDCVSATNQKVQWERIARCMDTKMVNSFCVYSSNKYFVKCFSSLNSIDILYSCDSKSQNDSMTLFKFILYMVKLYTIDPPPLSKKSKMVTGDRFYTLYSYLFHCKTHH